MSTEANKQVVRRFYDEVMGQGKTDVLDELMVENFIDHGEALFGSEPGRQNLKNGVAYTQNIFPDFHVQLHQMIADGDMVGVVGTMTCTQQGDFLGVPTSGNELTWKGIAMFRLENGKIAERWFNSDSLSIATQMGIVSLKM